LQAHLRADFAVRGLLAELIYAGRIVTVAAAAAAVVVNVTRYLWSGTAADGRLHV
jgi:hypothetical protein